MDKHIEADYEDHGLTYTIYVINSGRFGEAGPWLAFDWGWLHRNILLWKSRIGVRRHSPPAVGCLHNAVYFSNSRCIAIPARRVAVYSYDLGDGGCGSMMFASETARYAWIDLSAGPLTYGPETAGEGIVTWFSIPRVDMVGLRAGSCASEWNGEMAIC